MFILYALAWFGVVRFNEMKKFIGSISYKTLSSTLKELEADDLVHREEYPQIPPKVEYSLTERGKSLMPILDQMCTWGGTFYAEVKDGVLHVEPYDYRDNNAALTITKGALLGFLGKRRSLEKAISEVGAV